MPTVVLPPWTPFTIHSRPLPLLAAAWNWSLSPAPIAAYCGLIVTEPLCPATGGGCVGGGSDDVPCDACPFTWYPQPETNTRTNRTTNPPTARTLRRSKVDGMFGIWAASMEPRSITERPRAVRFTRPLGGQR